MEIMSEVENSKLPQFSKQQLDDLLRIIYQLHSPPQGGKRRLKPPRRVECGERLFGNVDPKKVVDLFIAALEHVPTFEEEFKLVNHKLDFDAGILHILVQSFFIWMEMYESKWRKQKKAPTTPTNKSSKSRTLISTKNATVEEDFRIPQDQRTPSPPANRLSNKLKNMAQISGEQNANNNGPSTSTPSPAQGQQKQRILIHPNHRNRLLDLLIPIDFTGKGPYIWKAIFNILELKNQKYLTTFIARVLDFVEKGKVSFTVLHYCLSHSNISGRMAIPKLLPTALLLGSLDAQTVEQFVANRTEQFRAECRRLLLQAESWKLDEKKFQDAVQEFTHRSHLQAPSHAQFNTTLTSLLSELRKEVCVNQTNLVNDYWAISLIRSAANKYYKEKSWSADQFNDLIHTLLVQRPAQKSFLLNVLLKDHNDKQAWERWRNFVSSDRIHMSKNFQKMSLYSKEDSPEFLSLPRKCDVFFIGNVQQFCIFKKQFEEYEQKKQSTILCGIDAEWNSYVMKSSASLLQISLTHSIYLLDLDALHVHPDFLDFIDRFFMSTEIVKIGYQFSEDLVQMRQRLPNCIGLYRPANIYCIGKIVDELHRRSRTKLDFQLNQFLLPITEQEEEAMKEHTRQVKPGFRGRGGGNNGNNRVEKEKGIPQENGRPEDEFGFNEDEHSPPMAKSSNYKFGEQGLSYLCRSMLGKPLNKLEQCSVWDRRPLRSSQIRYAALDAHCLIRLFQRCKEWCVALDAGDDPLYMVPVSCLHVSLPLFWNKPLPSNLPESAIAPWQQQKEEEIKTNDGSWDEDELKNNDGWGWKDVVEENGGQPADGN